MVELKGVTTVLLDIGASISPISFGILFILAHLACSPSGRRIRSVTCSTPRHLHTTYDLQHREPRVMKQRARPKSWPDSATQHQEYQDRQLPSATTAHTSSAVSTSSRHFVSYQLGRTPVSTFTFAFAVQTWCDVVIDNETSWSESTPREALVTMPAYTNSSPELPIFKSNSRGVLIVG